MPTMDTNSTRRASVSQDHRPSPEGRAYGAWLIVSLVMILFLLFFGTTVFVYGWMSDWFSVLG